MSEPQRRDAPRSRSRRRRAALPLRLQKGSERPLSSADLDRWVALAGGDAPLDNTDRQEAVAELRRRLLAVLVDDDASLVPPSAGHRSPEEWDAMAADERRVLQGQQLARLDPRLIPRTVLRRPLA
jgi:hypothetical protein